MNLRQAWIVVALWLATVTAFYFWFDYAAVTAIFHQEKDMAGNTLFQVPGYANTVYPFTYVGVAASLVGVAWFVYAQERDRIPKWGAALLGVLVANVASIGMIDVYEQAFVTLGYFTPQSHASDAVWLQLYWGNPSAAAGTFGGMVIVLSILPWVRKRNWPGVALCGALTGVVFAVWFARGFWFPPNGDAADYWMNALSRVASQLALVAAVSSTDWVQALARSTLRPSRRLFGGILRRPQDFAEVTNPAARPSAPEDGSRF